MNSLEKSILLSDITTKRQKFKKIFYNDKSKEQLYKWLKSELAYTSNNIDYVRNMPPHLSFHEGFITFNHLSA